VPGAKRGDLCMIRGVPRTSLGHPSNWLQCTVVRSLRHGEQVSIADYGTVQIDRTGVPANEPAWLVQGALFVFADGFQRILQLPEWFFLDRYLFPQRPVEDHDIYGFKEDNVDSGVVRRELEKM
jgi:hypothetical protein